MIKTNSNVIVQIWTSVLLNECEVLLNAVNNNQKKVQEVVCPDVSYSSVELIKKTPQCGLCQTAVKEDWRLVGCRLSRSGCQGGRRRRARGQCGPGDFSFPFFSLFPSCQASSLISVPT